MDRLPAPVSGRTWIEQVNALFNNIEGHVRMAEDDKPSLRKPTSHAPRAAFGRAAVVDDGYIYARPTLLDPLREGQAMVVIPQHGEHGSDIFQLPKNLQSDHISGVDDGIDTIKKLVRFCRQIFRPQWNVCIRQNTDEHVQVRICRPKSTLVS